MTPWLALALSVYALCGAVCVYAFATTYPLPAVSKYGGKGQPLERNPPVNTYNRLAYDAGWNASKRTTSYDLDEAERRFEKKNGHDYSAMFVAGWTDYASEHDKYDSLKE